MKKNKATHFMAGILIIFFVSIFLILTGRFLYIQATGEVNDVSLKEWAKEKRTASYTLNASRGKIFDNNGMTLAYDRPTYRLYAIINDAYSGNSKNPKHVDNPEETAKQLAPILDMKESDILAALEQGIENEKFQVEFGKKGRKLSQKEKEDIEALKLPGLNFEKEAMRYYPNGTFASHIIGFAKENEKKEKDGSYSNEITGITGIEKEMNELLSGKNGQISYQRDKYNKKLLNPKETIKQPEDGDDVYLTIDQKIQTLLEDTLSQVEDEFKPERVTAIVMNPKTGEIIAMSNRPSYNPNNPTDVKNWYNDAISTPFEPGSTVKMFTWAAAIEEGVYNGDETYHSGEFKANEKMKPIYDHNGGKGWGEITFDEGFKRSSNVAASKLAWEKIGPDKYLNYLEAFGFDKKTDIDLPGEIPGQILYNWPAEKISTAFGQGSTVTPIQQMKAATAIVNGGKMLQPYVIKKIIDTNTNEVIEQKSPNVVGEPISEETAEQVKKLLESVVNEEHGTGQMYHMDDYTVGGKTGTAQIPNPEPGGSPFLTGKENYIFSFLGMAPMDDPELMMYVSVKQPELEDDELGSLPVSFVFNNVMENSLHYLNIEPDKGENASIDKVKIPDLIDADPAATQKSLQEKGLKVSVIGKGKKIVDSNVKAGDELLPNTHIQLVTDKPKMPDITNWSLRDVLQLADLLQLKVETFGNGYAVSQNIKKGTPLKKDDYLGVELLTPDEKEKKDTEAKKRENETE